MRLASVRPTCLGRCQHLCTPGRSVRPSGCQCHRPAESSGAASGSLAASSPPLGAERPALPLRKAPGAVLLRKGPCAGLLNPQAYTLTPSGRGPWCLWSKTYLLNPKQKLLDSKATQGIEPKIEPVTEALTRRNAVPNAAPPASPDVCLTLLARTRYRFCPLLRCAGHSWPSDQRQETGHANKCRSVVAAASISQKHRRSVAR